jgi:hypothetical protein
VLQLVKKTCGLREKTGGGIFEQARDGCFQRRPLPWRAKSLELRNTMRATLPGVDRSPAQTFFIRIKAGEILLVGSG